MSIKFSRVKLYIGLVDRDGNLYHNVIDKMITVGLSLAQIDGATVHHVGGYWEGEKEDSIILEILLPEADLTLNSKAFALATFFKNNLNQDSVLITTEPVHGTFI